MTSIPAGAFTTTLSLIDFLLGFFSGFLSFPFLDFGFGFSGSAGGIGASGGGDVSTDGKASGSGIVVVTSSDASAG